MEGGDYMNIELWICGFMFTCALVADDKDKWYHILPMFFMWPFALGYTLRKVIKL